MRSTQRLPFSLAVPWERLRHSTPKRKARLQSMEGSLPPPLLQNRACHFCGTRLLSDAPSVIGIRPTVDDNRSDLWSDVSRLSLAGHRSLTLQRGSSASPALLLPITCTITVLTSAYPRHYPRPWLLEESLPVRLAVGTCSGPALQAGEHVRGYVVPDPSLAMNVGWSTLPGACGVNASHAEKGWPRHQCLLAPACQPLSLVQPNDSFMTFLCVPIFISARGVARYGFSLIRFHARFTD